MALHGRTKIELTDIHTGKVETIEKSNFITNGVAEFNKPLGGFLESYGLLYGQNLIPFYGSLALFDTPIEGDENTIFPAASNVCVGAAEYGVVNGTSDTWLGNYNSNESVIDTVNKTATFVYDFTTAQCNGNIGSVCLMPQNCGMGGVWGISGGISSASRQCALSTIKSNMGQYSHDIHFKPYTNEFDWNTNHLNPITIDMESAIGYYINTSVSPYTLEKRRLNFNSVSLFDTAQNTTSALLESHELGSAGMSETSICPPSDFDLFDETHFYTFYYEVTKSSSPYAGNIYLCVWSLSDGSFTKSYKFTLTDLEHGITKFYPFYYDGYAYFMYNTSNNVYRAPISNPTAFEIATKSDDVPTAYYLYPAYVIGGRIIASPFLFGGSYPMSYRSFSINTDSFDIRNVNHSAYTLNYKMQYTKERMMGVKNHPLLRIARCNYNNSSWGPMTNTNWIENFRIFLSTINNLDEVVTKTSDKTMKITYTLTEVAGE